MAAAGLSRPLLAKASLKHNKEPSSRGAGVPQVGSKGADRQHNFPFNRTSRRSLPAAEAARPNSTGTASRRLQFGCSLSAATGVPLCAAASLKSGSPVNANVSRTGTKGVFRRPDFSFREMLTRGGGAAR